MREMRAERLHARPSSDEQKSERRHAEVVIDEAIGTVTCRVLTTDTSSTRGCIEAAVVIASDAPST
jgi:hypothetical protein